MPQNALIFGFKLGPGLGGNKPKGTQGLGA